MVSPVGRFCSSTRPTVEGALVGHVVDKQYPHSTSVVRRGDRPEPFLACCVPYLQLHSLTVQLDGSDLEVDAYGRNKGRGEGIFAKSKKTT